ncbi:MAG TPA: branched-chain amino acid ABC transporter permease [Methylomirabilota bacterium]|jgi:branched-chain amino acid transport system permease protein|nr:branched-chain amino acid ABC transporter permease [Methylomirabilota bacterium]HEV8673498.1 branched-chain amino acid ABC transporter permease [Methylomirabilota bacterium]
MEGWGAVYLQQVVNGLTIGSVYALIALGYTMVYGVLEMINFAHGDVFMVGSFVGLLVLALLAPSSSAAAGGGLLLVLGAVFLGAMASCGSLGVTIERVAYRPLRASSRLGPLISALGVSLFIQNAVMLLVGARPKAFPQLIPKQLYHVGGAVFTNVQVIILLASLLLMLALDQFVRRTRWGRAMRAVAQDAEAAGFMGVEVNSVVTLTFLLGSILAAGAGIMVGLYYGIVDFFMGYVAGLKAFTAAVLGGIGNLRGAMLGGLLLGLAESFGAGFVGAHWRDVIAFGVLITVLVLRPGGLLGEHLPEKV